MNRKSTLSICALAASFALAACDKPAAPPPSSSAGPMEKSMEKMGQRMDNAAERAKEETAKAGQAIDDTAITAAVKADILKEPGLKVLMIDVDTKDGKVTLSGSADSAANVKKAEQIASNVQGVKSVENRLAVSSKG